MCGGLLCHGACPADSAIAQTPVQEIKPGMTIDGIAAIVGKEIILESDVMAAETMERGRKAARLNYGFRAS